MDFWLIIGIGLIAVSFTIFMFMVDPFELLKRKKEIKSISTISTVWPREISSLPPPRQRVTFSGWSSDESFMEECWRRTTNKEKCDLCEYRFKCYTNKVVLPEFDFNFVCPTGISGPTGGVGPVGAIGATGPIDDDDFIDYSNTPQ